MECLPRLSSAILSSAPGGSCIFLWTSPIPHKSLQYFSTRLLQKFYGKGPLPWNSTRTMYIQKIYTYSIKKVKKLNMNNILCSFVYENNMCSLLYTNKNLTSESQKDTIALPFRLSEHWYKIHSFLFMRTQIWAKKVHICFTCWWLLLQPSLLTEFEWDNRYVYFQ